MDGNTTLILIYIFTIGLIAIIIVKLYYRRHQEKDKDINIGLKINSLLQSLNKNENDPYRQHYNRQNKLRNYHTNENINQERFNRPAKNQINSLNTNELYNNLDNVNFHNEAENQSFEKPQTNIYGDNMSPNNNPEKINFENNNITRSERKDIAEKISQKDSYSELINKDQSTKKETYEELQNNNETKNIKVQNNTPDHELKDLFTIDELIKESKRKDSERNKIEEETTIKEKTNTPQKKESEDKSKYTKINITNKTDNYSEPSLKSPTKVKKPIENIIKENVEEKINELPQTIDQSTKKEESYENKTNNYTTDQPLNENLFEKSSEVNIDQEDNHYIDIDLTTKEEDFQNNIHHDPSIPDYAKDIAKITNTFKKSKIFNSAKNKIFPNENDDEYINDPTIDENFIRNVRSYGEPEYETEQNKYESREDIAVIEPIHNEKYDEVVDKKIRDENTKKLNKKPEKTQPQEPTTKNNNITFKLNNDNVTLNTNDEIIFTFNDESYSSKVYKIIGEDITVKFRNKYITIKPSDIKKIF